MAIIYKTHKSDYIIESRGFYGKKFLGLVFSLDFDVPQGSPKETIFVITFKFLFFGFWLAFQREEKVSNRYIDALYSSMAYTLKKNSERLGQL